MPSYGFIMSQVRIHAHGQKESPVRIGTLAPPDEAAGTGTNEGLKILYGVLNGLIDTRVPSATGTRHLKVKTVDGVGQCVKFSYELGTSGQDSVFTDPETGEDSPVFRRLSRHIEIEKERRRGLLVAPDNSATGMLVLEAHGRQTGRELLRDELKRSFRWAADGLILDVDPYVDPAALARYLEEVNINSINLRRSNVPSDLAATYDMDQGEASAGSLKMQLTGSFRRELLD